MKTFIKRILVLINLVFAFLLLLSYLPGVVNPSKLSVLAFFSLFYPFLLIINILFIFLWGFFLKKYFLISVIAILIRVNYIPLYIQNKKASFTENTENSIHVMSFNAHLFRYEHKNVHKGHISSFKEILEKYSPNIICFQEFTSSNQSEDMNILKTLKKDYNLKYHFSQKENKNFTYSNTIVSKYPIIKKGNVFENHTDVNLPAHRFIYADLKINNDTIRVYNVHFSSFHLDENDKAAYDEIVSQQKFDNKKSRRLFGKLNRTVKKHGEEVKILVEHISGSPYKKIVCGDFNDTPASYAYQQLSKQLDDTYRKKGKGIGKTYNGPYPAFRIDYIFSDKDFTVESFQTIKADISDHYPIFSTLSLANPKNL